MHTPRGKPFRRALTLALGSSSGHFQRACTLPSRGMRTGRRDARARATGPTSVHHRLHRVRPPWAGTVNSPPQGLAGRQQPAPRLPGPQKGPSAAAEGRTQAHTTAARPGLALLLLLCLPLQSRTQHLDTMPTQILTPRGNSSASLPLPGPELKAHRP